MLCDFANFNGPDPWLRFELETRHFKVKIT